MAVVTAIMIGVSIVLGGLVLLMNIATRRALNDIEKTNERTFRTYEQHVEMRMSVEIGWEDMPKTWASMAYLIDEIENPTMRFHMFHEDHKTGTIA